jgi:UDP-glucose 4-epimerase
VIYNRSLQPFHQKRVLITGGAGFVGSHLAEKLVAVCSEVISLDNYISGSKSNHIEGVNYFDGDVNDILDIFRVEKFDFIFHFGEYSRVEQSLSEPHLAISNIYKSFASLLEFWRVSGAKLIYSGSSTKFANNGEGRHLSPYTAAKALNSELLIDYAKWYTLPYATAYFYNVYGGRELREGKFSTVVGKFKKLRSNGVTRLPVTLPGSQRRNFTHIDDIVAGILLAAAKGMGDGYEIGANESYSIIDLCELFGCEPDFQRPSAANRMDGELCTDKIKELGWKQTQYLDLEIKSFLQVVEKR